MTTRAVFIDKDGTLVNDVPYNTDPAHLCFTPRAIEGLQSMRAAGYELVLVSNQSGLARGLFGEEALEQYLTVLWEMLAGAGAPFLAFYVCPHLTQGSVQRYAVRCDCRKPGPGLMRRAAEENNIDLAESWLVGDILDDVEAGKRAGCRTIFMAPGGETEWRMTPLRMPDHLARNLYDAAEIIAGRARPAMRFQVQTGQLGGVAHAR